MFRVPIVLAMAAAAAVADTYPRQPNVDAEHYVFQITIGDDRDEISGEALAGIRFLKDGIGEFSLDLASTMNVSEVRSGEKPVQYSHRGDRLTISLVPPSRAGERRQFSITYQGKPASGLYFSKNSHGDRGIFSVNWPNLANQWIPISDHP